MSEELNNTIAKWDLSPKFMEYLDPHLSLLAIDFLKEKKVTSKQQTTASNHIFFILFYFLNRFILLPRLRMSRLSF